MSTAMLVRNDATLGITLSKEGLVQRETALAASALIGKVTNADEQQKAVDAQKLLYEFRRAVEKSRVLVKAPVIAFGKKIDEIAASSGNEVADEELRISRMVADFQALEMQKIRAAQLLEQQKLEAAEKERQEALAQATSHKEVEAIQADFCEKQAELQKPVLPPPKAAGQSVKEVWDYEVTDLNLLADKHRAYVKIEPRRADILAALDRGIEFNGLRAFKVTKSSVRV